jgi:aspartate/methionine/tyrosine aminotransferase
MMPRTPRGAVVPPFYAGEIAREAAALAAQGRDIVPMHFGEPRLAPPPAALEAARRATAADLASTHAYWHSAALQQRIARHYRDACGVEVAPERILLTNGASAGLVAAFTVLFAAGDRVGIARPGYPAYRNSLQALQRSVVEIDAGAAQGWRLTADAVAATAAETGGLQGLIVASPGNPTGVVLAREELAALAAECRRQHAWLISDEIYHGITYGGRAASALEVEPEAIVVNSFSKLYRMPGWRLGWLVVPQRLIDSFRTHLINLFLTPTSVSQHAALAAMDATDDISAAVAGYAANRARLLDGLPPAGLPRLCVPDGAFYIYADVADYTDDSLALCRRLLADTGVAITPGIDFDTVHGGSHVRFSFAGSLDDVDRALARLAPWLAAQPRRAGAARGEPAARAGTGLHAR